MRLPILPILLTGVSAVSLAAAEPIRVIENSSSANANIRFGHALANANVNGNDDNVARVVRPAVVMNITPQRADKGIFRHFCGASLREKALSMSNAFRHALGLPLIETEVAVPRPGGVHILPLPYPPPNVIFHPQEQLDEEGKPRKHHERPDHHRGEDQEHRRPHHGRYGHHGHHKHNKSFLKRIHKAITTLGPWEGRAVAFVLGCGIGVLLRMFWVLSVLGYRTVRGEHGEETLDREYIVYGQVPETLFVAPPEYVDEKVMVEAHNEDVERK